MNQPGLTADLASIDLLDLVQVIYLDRRDLLLVLRAGARTRGVLRFAQGDLLWAEFEALRGDEAFMALAAQKSGSIEQLPWDGNSQRNVHQPLSRLIMQAVGYREQWGGRDAERGGAGESQGMPLQGRGGFASAPSTTRSHFLGAARQPRGTNGYSMPTQEAPFEPEQDAVPAWVRQIQSAADEFSAQPTEAMSLTPVPGARAGSPTPPPGDLPAVGASLEVVNPSRPQPTVPLSRLNGRLSLPGLNNGGRGQPSTPGRSSDDPPTVPLPSVSGGLMEYAQKREVGPALPGGDSRLQPASAEEGLPAPGHSGQTTKLVDSSPLSPLLPSAAAGADADAFANMPTLPSQMASASSANGAARASLETPNMASAVPPATEPLSLPLSSAPVAPPPLPPALAALASPPQEPVPVSNEPKLSSLALLEQLAYGWSSQTGSGDSPASPSNGATNGTHDLAALAGQAAAQRSPAPLLETGPVVYENATAPLSFLPAATVSLSPSSEAASAALPAGTLPAAKSLPLPASLSVSTEASRQLRQGLETFAGQVGTAFLATAIIRTDGAVIAQHAAGRHSEQDFASPAYHMAHVMQSSLRTLLMGGWGDLEDTMITGSTHVVVLRRLGRAEKGLFYVAVLERSGNPGLCRVLMRNTETALLRLL